MGGSKEVSGSGKKSHGGLVLREVGMLRLRGIVLDDLTPLSMTV